VSHQCLLCLLSVSNTHLHFPDGFLGTIYLFFGGTGVSPQGFTLAKQAVEKQVLYCLSHISSIFALVIGDGVSQIIWGLELFAQMALGISRR
jgi:hypothetical protein